MKENDAPDSRFDELWTDFLEGELEAPALAELEDLIAVSPERLATACDRYQHHRLLGWVHEASDQDSADFVAATLGKLPASSEDFALRTLAKLPVPPRRRLQWLAPALAAAAIALVFALGNRPTEHASPVPVAQLILAEDCEWAPGSDHLAEGQPLTPGYLALRSGSAVVRFDGGAELVLTGDSKIELVGGASARLHHGRVVVRAEDGAEGFILTTPASEIIDLGTEFAVQVDRSGATDLQVHEGEVSANSIVVGAGKALRFDGSDTKVGRETVAATDSPRFDEMIRRANPRERRDLMQVYEGFFVDADDYPLPAMDGGTGWAGPWRLPNESEGALALGANPKPTLRIAHGRMDAPWPVRGGRLGGLELPPGRQVLLREIDRPIDLGEDGITFISFMVANAADAEDPGHLDIVLRSSGKFYGGKLGFGLARSGQPLIRTGGGSICRGTRPFPLGGTLFCVGKIVRSAHWPDALFFRCYHPADHLAPIEPADWDVGPHRIDLSSEFDHLEISAWGSAERWIDEIRIGPTWRSVTPIDPDRK